MAAAAEGASKEPLLWRFDFFQKKGTYRGHSPFWMILRTLVILSSHKIFKNFLETLGNGDTKTKNMNISIRHSVLISTAGRIANPIFFFPQQRIDTIPSMVSWSVKAKPSIPFFQRWGVPIPRTERVITCRNECWWTWKSKRIASLQSLPHVVYTRFSPKTASASWEEKFLSNI